MRRKTLILSAEFPPHGGGAGVIAKQIINDAKLQNIQLDCVVNLPRENFIQRFCFEFIFYCRLLTYDLNNYDLIILNDTRSVLFASHFFSKKILNKCLLIAHGRDYDKYHPSNISLLDKLITSYNKEIEFKQEMRGTAEIITEDLRLIQRFFYQFNKIIKR